MEAIRAGHRQEAAALGAPSSPPLSRGLQGAWTEWARLGSSQGSGPVTRPLVAPSLLRPDFPGRLRGARGPGRRGVGVAPPGPAHPPGCWLGIGRGGMGGARARSFGGAEEPPPPVGGAACRYGQGAVPGHETTNSRAPLPAPGPGLASGSRVPAPLGDSSDPRTEIQRAAEERGRG